MTNTTQRKVHLSDTCKDGAITDSCSGLLTTLMIMSRGENQQNTEKSKYKENEHDYKKRLYRETVRMVIL